MTRKALWVSLTAKAGREQDVQEFLADALPLAREEAGTTAWFALQLGDNKFGIFDAFPDEDARDAHLNGKIAKALLARASELLSEAPRIEKVDVLADKVRSPGGPP